MEEPPFTVNIKITGLKWDEDLRQRFLSFVSRYKWSYGQVSRDIQRFYGKRKDKDGRPRNAGLGETTLYTYSSLKWKGSQERLEKLEARLRGWLDNRDQGGKVTEIDESVSAAKLIQYGLVEAYQSRKFVVIVGQSGVGKTLLTRHFAHSKTTGGLVVVECYDGMTPRAFLAAICAALGELEAGTKHDLLIRAAGMLSEQPKILAIDEANFISEQSINHLVYIWNQAKNGIVLLGTDELQRVVKSSRLQRVRSRMKLMITLNGLTGAEVKDKLLESFNEKEVTAKVTELALIGSYGSYRDLETIIETAIDYRDKNPDIALEDIFERVAFRVVEDKQRGK
jgi:DNA transposition AAA+ family ATPase